MASRRGLHELYSVDAEHADERLWGRRCDPLTRRGFLHGSGLATMSAVIGAAIMLAGGVQVVV